MVGLSVAGDPAVKARRWCDRAGASTGCDRGPPLQIHEGKAVFVVRAWLPRLAPDLAPFAAVEIGEEGVALRSGVDLRQVEAVGLREGERVDFGCLLYTSDAADE